MQQTGQMVIKAYQASDFSLTEIQTNSSRFSYYVDFIGSQVGSDGPITLPTGKQSILISFWAEGIICNSGLQYFYESSNDPTIVASAFRELGLTEAAEAMEVSMLAFPAGLLEVQVGERIDWMNLHRADLERAWENPENVIMGLSRNSPEGPGDILEVASRKYIREHLTQFDFEA
jgi:hypothetical protein